jgi:CheY-like chemotaxis protein
VALAAGAPAAARPEGTAGTAHGASLARVLYIEDNPVNLTLMESMLERMPEVYACCVNSGTEGLVLAAAEPPRLILLDLQMPVMDGFEVLRRLRADPALREIPVYAVSANAQPGYIAAARAAGFDGYLTKPVQLDSLIDTVRGVLRAGQVAAAG